MLAGLAAFFLAASLIAETAFRGQIPLGRGLAIAGLAFLVAAVLAPYRPPCSPESGDRMAVKPHFGHTKHGLAVHAKVTDHLPEDSAYARFNKKVAIWLVGHIGTMTTFWLFLFLAFLSLPATLVLASLFRAPAHTVVLTFALSYGFIFLVDWLCQNVIQLVLLPGLMVGQNLQNAASDARSAKQFEDVEEVRTDLLTALDRLDVSTEGGIKAVLDAVNALAAQQRPVRRLATPAERSEGAGA